MMQSRDQVCLGRWCEVLWSMCFFSQRQRVTNIKILKFYYLFGHVLSSVRTLTYVTGNVNVRYRKSVFTLPGNYNTTKLMNVVTQEVCNC